MCGLCCKLFLINLSEEEYKSGRYKTMFEEFEKVKDFSENKKYGINLLAQKEDGSCIYLLNNSCKIHKKRPQVCREFFCASKNKKYKKMQEIIRSVSLRNLV
jgi:Fe-S-cluster containining protein